MYTGQLEYWTSEQNTLYRTAQKMNMPVLIKLLDAQLNNGISENLSFESQCDGPSFSELNQISATRKASTVLRKHCLPEKK